MKPVAYCVTNNNHIECLCFNEGYAQKHADRCEKAQVIPLYTHPVKELTDEEINEIFSKTWLDFQDYKDFARAILRKAQEK